MSIILFNWDNVISVPFGGEFGVEVVVWEEVLVVEAEEGMLKISEDRERWVRMEAK